MNGSIETVLSFVDDGWNGMQFQRWQPSISNVALDPDLWSRLPPEILVHILELACDDIAKLVGKDISVAIEMNQIFWKGQLNIGISSLSYCPLYNRAFSRCMVEWENTLAKIGTKYVETGAIRVSLPTMTIWAFKCPICNNCHPLEKEKTSFEQQNAKARFPVGKAPVLAHTYRCVKCFFGRGFTHARCYHKLHNCAYIELNDFFRLNTGHPMNDCYRCNIPLWARLEYLETKNPAQAVFEFAPMHRSFQSVVLDDIVNNL